MGRFSDFTHGQVEIGRAAMRARLADTGACVPQACHTATCVCARKHESPRFKSRLCVSCARDFSLLSLCSLGCRTRPGLPRWFGARVTSDRRCEGVWAQAVTSGCCVSADVSGEAAFWRVCMVPAASCAERACVLQQEGTSWKYRNRREKQHRLYGASNGSFKNVILCK